MRSKIIAIAVVAGAAWGQSPVPSPELSFEPNRGQTGAQVRFLARAGGYRLFLTGEAAVLALDGDRPASLTMRLVGANPAPKITGLERRPGVSNYIAGPDASQWITGVEQYAKVRYQQVYPDIDLVYYGRGPQLEHDFIVAPGADYRTIRLRFEGARALRIDASGGLEIVTSAGTLREPAPVLYQEIGGARTYVAGSYRIAGEHEVAFEAGAYDARRPLIIDPIFNYFATYVGGGAQTDPTSLAVDPQGNAYIAGITQSLDFPTVDGRQSSNAGKTDIFVTKLDGTFGNVIYSTYLGGSADDVANQIKVDAAGNVYLAGTTESSDFPVTQGAFQTTPHGTPAAFVTKLKADGSALVYSTFLGGSGGEAGQGLGIDQQGAAYVVGATFSHDFPVKGTFFGAVAGGGDSDGFVAKLNPAGTDLVYSAYLGGRGTDVANAIFVDSIGQASVVGWTSSDNLPVTADEPIWPTRAGGLDGFVALVSSNGLILQHMTYFGGSDDDALLSITQDPRNLNQVYVSGVTASLDFPGPTGPSATSVAAGRAIPFEAKLTLPGAVSTNARAASIRAGGQTQPKKPDYDWYIPIEPRDCTEVDWKKLLDQLKDDTKRLKKASKRLNALANDYIPQLVSVPKDVAGLIDDLFGPLPPDDSCKNASVVPGDGARNEIATGKLFTVDAATGVPVDFPPLAITALDSPTTVRALVASSGGDVYMLAQTLDMTLPVTGLGAPPTGAGPTTYVVRLSGQMAPPKAASLANGASFSTTAPVSPGSLISIFGTFPGVEAAQAQATPLPTNLGGVSVSMNGVAVPIYFVNGSQINAQVPWELSAGPANAVVSLNGVPAAPLAFTVGGAQPGIFTFGTNHAVAQNQDYSLNNTGSGAAPGSVITVYLTGGADVDNPYPSGAAAPSSPLAKLNAPATATIGGQTAEVAFIGMTPGLVGVVQANLKVPQLSPGDYPVVISLRGTRSNAPLVTVGN